ncbi:hypothetical protein CAEBREN_14775 [Caenorhabditis brenneri]|uniref:Uncharacterized protein n=1 Tax=Caenorhabditis brenneri TaxID=135651 RepID=G0NZS8_CAEBE|nr:hypothetical protein CAEBREN_14775 [Caenorhabditis brenneri]
MEPFLLFAHISIIFPICNRKIFSLEILLKDLIKAVNIVTIHVSKVLGCKESLAPMLIFCSRKFWNFPEFF